MDDPTERDDGSGSGLGGPESDEIESAFDVEFEEGLPESVDRSAVRRMQLVANFLDDSIRIPGTSYRIGVDPIIGVVPAAGDVVSAALSMYIVAESARLGVSQTTLLRMIANVSIDVAGGTIPYVGGVFDAAWKANKRNMQLFVEDVTGGDGGDSDEGVTHIEIE